MPRRYQNSRELLRTKAKADIKEMRLVHKKHSQLGALAMLFVQGSHKALNTNSTTVAEKG